MASQKCCYGKVKKNSTKHDFKNSIRTQKEVNVSYSRKGIPKKNLIPLV
jgi:hypothetical protein